MATIELENHRCCGYHRHCYPYMMKHGVYEAWYCADLLHRTDGPAVIQTGGGCYWWVRGQNISEEVEAWMQAHGITWPFTPEQQVDFVLRWG